jgi:hypothetical protein
MVLQREMVWYMREMVVARKEGRKPHTHSIHNRMLHLIQDVQKDAGLQGAPGGGEGGRDAYYGLVGGGEVEKGMHVHYTITNKEGLDRKIKKSTIRTKINRNYVLPLLD